MSELMPEKGHSGVGSHIGRMLGQGRGGLDSQK